MCPNTFDDMVRSSKMPKPKQLTGKRMALDVRALDIAIDHLPHVGDNAAYTTWDED